MRIHTESAVGELSNRAQIILKSLREKGVRVAQCFNASLSGQTSPERVEVWFDTGCDSPYTKSRPRVSDFADVNQYRAARLNHTEQWKSESGRLMNDASLLLLPAGIKFRMVNDGGWFKLILS